MAPLTNFRMPTPTQDKKTMKRSGIGKVVQSANPQKKHSLQHPPLGE